MIRKLDLNKGGYRGERIKIERIVRRILVSAISQGWQVDSVSTSNAISLHALSRGGEIASAPRVYISAGIHGDEPAGPCALAELLEEERLPREFGYWVCPCLNPTGFGLSTRENADGVDLNREYHAPSSDEVRSHIAWLENQPPFDVAFCLHEDWESNGFYLYELNLGVEESLAQGMIDAVSKVCPVDLAPEIEGRAAVGGIIRPNPDPLTRPQWPEAFYLIQHKTRRSYTLEAPSDFPLPVRVAAIKAAMIAALAMLRR